MRDYTLRIQPVDDGASVGFDSRCENNYFEQFRHFNKKFLCACSLMDHPTGMLVKLCVNKSLIQIDDQGTLGFPGQASRQEVWLIGRGERRRQTVGCICFQHAFPEVAEPHALVTQPVALQEEALHSKDENERTRKPFWPWLAICSQSFKDKDGR